MPASGPVEGRGPRRSGASVRSVAWTSVQVEAGVTSPAGLDEAAIRAFVVEDYPRIVTGLSVMCGSRTAAEDAVQDALAKAWERSERGEHIEQLAGWVTVVARNSLRSWFRRVRAERRAREALGEETGARASAGTPDDRVDVARALALLTKTQ